MFCPSCKCEYIHGVTQCADCGVPLVDALESPEATPAEDIRIVLIWRGKDSSECERTGEALESAGIPFTVQDAKSSFSFLPSMEIWISNADRERARKVLLDLDERVYPDELTPAEIESLALPESEIPGGDEHQGAGSDLSENWDEDEPAAEVWNGDKEVFADTLMACLREVGIASRKLPEEGHWRLAVRPEQESRAKEIVREVVEASPPE